MKKRTILLSILTVLGLISMSAKSVKTTSDEVTKVVTVTSRVNSIEFNNAFNVIFTDEVEANSIEITASEDIINYVNVVIDDDEVKISLKNRNFKNPEILIRANANKYKDVDASGAVSITYATPVVAYGYDIDLSGASSLSGLKIECTELSIDASGASSVKNLTVNCTILDVDISGASSVTVRGNATSIDELECSGSSTFDGSKLATNRVEFDLSGTSNATVQSDGSLSLRGNSSGVSSLKIVNSSGKTTETISNQTINR
ncbi:MAG: DUF2807 domain-containing protein [bacterium]